MELVLLYEPKYFLSCYKINENYKKCNLLNLNDMDEILSNEMRAVPNVNVDIGHLIFD